MKCCNFRSIRAECISADETVWPVMNKLSKSVSNTMETAIIQVEDTDIGFQCRVEMVEEDGSSSPPSGSLFSISKIYPPSRSECRVINEIPNDVSILTEVIGPNG